MPQPLQHFELVVDHLFVSLDVLLQDYLDGHLASGAVGFANNSIGSSTKSSTESILGSTEEMLWSEETVF